MIGKAAARQGSTTISAPSGNLRMWSWHVAVPALRPVRLTVDHECARPADALPAVVLERDGVLALGDQSLVEDVEQLEERSILADLVDVVLLEAPSGVRTVLAPHLERQVAHSVPMTVHCLPRRHL